MSLIELLNNLEVKEIAGIASGCSTFFVTLLGLSLKWLAGRLKSNRYKKVKAKLEQVGDAVVKGEGQSLEEKIKEIAKKLEELKE